MVDYAFNPPGDRAGPVAFLEAKRMSEDLTDDHRDQVHTYALDRVGIRVFGLTNGDIWKFYELSEGEPRMTFEFTIQGQPASDHAHILLRHFPMLTRPGAERPIEPMEALSPPIGNEETSSAGSEVHNGPSQNPSNHVDVRKAIFWLNGSLLASGVLGWASGVWRAEPIEGFFQYVGLFTIVLVTVQGAALGRRFFSSVSSLVLRILQFNWLITPINGNRGKPWFGLG